jgi:hypothetical protein
MHVYVLVTAPFVGVLSSVVPPSHRKKQNEQNNNNTACIVALISSTFLHDFSLLLAREQDFGHAGSNIV